MERLILIRKSTGDILDYNATYFRGDLSLPPDGLDEDLEYLMYHEPFTAPSYDSRYYNLVVVKSITTEPHPVYAHFNQYQITFNTVKKPVTDIKVAAEDAESKANDLMIPAKKVLKYSTLAIGSLIREANGATMTANDTFIRDKYLNLATRIFQNDAELQAKLAELDLGNEPDLDSGYHTTEEDEAI